MSKVIGILGGMGPYATLSFFNTILTSTEAKKDWEHIHLVIDNHTQIPSRTRYYLYNEESPIDSMIDACNKLVSYPVDAIAIPCNSAQAWYKELQEKINVKILNIFDITISTVANIFPKNKTICVLGARVTWGMQTYKTYVENYGFTYYLIDETTQIYIEKIIEEIKLNKQLNFIIKDLSNIMHNISQENPDVVFVLGCTEFGCINDKIDKQYAVIDSSTAYAKFIVKYAKEINI